MLRAGMKETDGYCRHNHGGKSFSQLAAADQDNILKGLEKGDIHLEAITARYFFSQLLAEVKAGYFADPKYGGNHGMGAWKMIGYPGVRADYSDWVEVRDRPYPLPPVDLSGRRG
jgi:gluconate 2-dehydrogenase gamma chain